MFSYSKHSISTGIVLASLSWYLSFLCICVFLLADECDGKAVHCMHCRLKQTGIASTSKWIPLAGCPIRETSHLPCLCLVAGHLGDETDLLWCIECRFRQTPTRRWDSCPRCLTSVFMVSSTVSTPRPGTQRPTTCSHGTCDTHRPHVPKVRLPQSCGFRAA